MDEDSLADDVEALLKASELATAAAHKLLESKKAEVKKKNVLVASKKERERTERLIKTLECAEDEKNELFDALRRQYAANPDKSLSEYEERLAECNKLFEELKNSGPP
ncbi:hypothetical protein IW261DRAFT_1571510 [Armillaria novae-zelandiae]|uniref:Uncharacterized protein n=1 Tax=Armillaria novae-zelandiae TaxID=153914 RepID=A0AA39NTZ6_9AGAR|nr:hypothetical protein IW261DRAFT_1571505 [Armillaria novae-zelandiae]KAK0471847.1 hypothetical protein IW261DRAFT_1571510 [Armillaria novae-zelandiae]